MANQNKKELDASYRRLAYGIREAAQCVGLSERFLRNAIFDPDPGKRLRTVRINRRRLVTDTDLAEWFARVSRRDIALDSLTS